MKTIWIINQYASPIGKGAEDRHHIIGKEFVKNGYTVYIIASSNHHLIHSPITNEHTIENIEGVNFVWITPPQYEGAHDKKRVIAWFYFAFKLLNIYKKIKSAPDLIWISSPSLISTLFIKRISSYFNAKLVFEVRDIWPLTLVKIGNISNINPLIVFMGILERRIYKNADIVLSNLEYADRHMRTIGLNPSKFYWIPNGLSTRLLSLKEKLDKRIVDQFPINKFVVGYTGTIGLSNELDFLIDSAVYLQNTPDIIFVIVGNGHYKKQLEDKVKKYNLNNVIFISSIRKSQVQSIIEKFDVCYVGTPNSSLYKFGIASIKIPEYMYSKTPIIHACNRHHSSPVKNANAGFVVANNEPLELSKAILQIKSMPLKDRILLGCNGRKYALNNYDYIKISNRLLSIFSNIPI